MNTTATLAQFIAESPSSRIPAEVRQHALRSWVNWAGCTVGGAQHDTVARAVQALQPFFGPAQANLLGRAEGTDALHAALINGLSSHVLDFDDTHMATLVHPSGPVVSALLALAQWRSMSGEAFIDAIVFGIETECRVAAGVCPAHYDLGWHVTGTVGGFGAAAAVGRAIGLDPRRMAMALGIAATQAAGLREMFGTMCKPLHPGRAAHSGLQAALLAEAGFTSSTQAIEAPRGFAQVLSPESDLAQITNGLGESWLTAENSFKPYACGLVVHPVIDGCIALTAHCPDPLTQVEEIHLEVHPLVLELTGKAAPTTGLEGKFSVFHSAAACLLEGKSRLRHYSDAVVNDPSIVALRQRVRAHANPKLRRNEARVTITLQQGKTLSHHVEHALGSLERPMRDHDISDKFRDLTQVTLGANRSEEALHRCWSLPERVDAGQVALSLVPPTDSHK